MSKLNNLVGGFAAGLLMAIGTAACTTPYGASNPIESADAAQQATANVEPIDAHEDDPLICKREAVIGSRFKKEVCMRQSDLDAQKQGTQDIMNQRGRGRANAPPGQ
jgi:hypothetical protein